MGWDGVVCLLVLALYASSVPKGCVDAWQNNAAPLGWIHGGLHQSVTPRWESKISDGAFFFHRGYFLHETPLVYIFLINLSLSLILKQQKQRMVLKRIEAQGRLSPA